VAECGFALQPNAERHLRPAPAAGRHLSAGELLAATCVVAARCTFTLDEIRYQYPHGDACPRHDALRRRCAWLTLTRGRHGRYPAGRALARAVKQIEHELRR
jgi:error-prone DNA polymerase